MTDRNSTDASTAAIMRNNIHVCSDSNERRKSVSSGPIIGIKNCKTKPRIAANRTAKARFTAARMYEANIPYPHTVTRFVMSGLTPLAPPLDAEPPIDAASSGPNSPSANAPITMSAT